ncbi:hypothetical protein IQ249_18070 [Lusitaniella coriacea LEGE 07157]|uniref:Uncharacterized protein n=1 Tax=Lusitaniella coriacea LEGE 07157 TaxID=945747 RepID=A0A8J7E2V8_9CYAN|nr:hypothetical protein [Lusitaniella coriacea]MBE9117809.1 hypothetical protein [Lusitaniella coriacea LEGE 07157]
MNFKDRKTLHQILTILVIASLIALFALRIYAIYKTVPIVTWDDFLHRKGALQGDYYSSFLGAIDDVIFPNPNLFDGHRSVGYHVWLVLGLKLSLSGNPEETWQLVNLILLGIQGAALFGLSRWATGQSVFAGFVTTLYLSSPIVFGMNRWIMTENFVFTATLIFSFLPALLLTRRFEVRWKEILAAIFVAWGIGIFATLREYALPSYFILSFCTVLALLWERRWVAAGFVFAILSGYNITMLYGWKILFRVISQKTTQVEYFHPMPEWIPHIILYAVGSALTILMVVGIGAILWRLFQLNQTSLKTRLTGLHIFWMGHLVLIPIYIAAILITDNRPVRAAIPLMMSLLTTILVGLRVVNLPQRWLNFPQTQAFFIGLIALSWVILSHQLFIAFDGGATYAHHATNLEYYNHPLRLRPLEDSNDMHVTY